MPTRLKQHLGLSILLCMATIFFYGKTRAAEKPLEQPLEKVAIAYSSISGNMAPLWVTYERGFFRKYGLDVQIVFIESGSTTVQSLISKEVAFAQMAGAGVIQSRLRGSDVTMIAGFLNTLDYQLMVDKNITRPDQLKGKIMAVSRFGSSSDFATRYALDKYGLVPEKDVTILEIGSQPARFAALEAGKIQAAMVAVPLTLKAKALGFHSLADLQMLGLEYQHTSLATTQALIKSRPDLVRNIMKAYIEGIHYYKTPSGGIFSYSGKVSEGCRWRRSDRSLRGYRACSYSPKTLSDIAWNCRHASGVGCERPQDQDRPVRGVCRPDLYQRVG